VKNDSHFKESMDEAEKNLFGKLKFKHHNKRSSVFMDDYLMEKSKLNHDSGSMSREKRFEELTSDDEDSEWEDNPLAARLSPAAKEKIYLDYRAGTSVTDISLRYGILNERVKAVVWQREYFWNYIYPKLGETGL